MLELQFHLSDGRQIFLEAFSEFKTYAGLLDGNPDASINLEILKSEGDFIQKLWPEQPSITLGLDYYKCRIHDTLPSIICAGHFISYQPVIEPEKAGSSLAVIWFQEEMFPLLQGQNAGWLKDVKWEEFARDFDW